MDGSGDIEASEAMLRSQESYQSGGCDAIHVAIHLLGGTVLSLSAISLSHQYAFCCPLQGVRHGIGMRTVEEGEGMTIMIMGGGIGGTMKEDTVEDRKDRLVVVAAIDILPLITGTGPSRSRSRLRAEISQRSEIS